MHSLQKGRNPALDFLRCIAIILVMFRHLHISGESLPALGARFLNGGGWVGVDLFFVLSGFLVSGLIFNEYEKYGSFDPWRFLIRRGFKLYPVYYLFLAITWGTALVHHFANSERNHRYLYEALFISNYTRLKPEHDWVWSLCVEEHFYLLLCVILVVLIRTKRVTIRAFWLLYLLLLVSGLALRTIDLFQGDLAELYPARSHLRFDELFFGVLLAYLHRRNVLPKGRTLLLTLIACVGIVLPFLFTRYAGRDQFLNYVVFPATNPLCFGWLMIRLLNTRPSWMRGFAWIGKYSYSIYLFHGVVNASCYRHFSGWKYYAGYLLGSLLIGVIISKLVEFPVLAIRDRLFPSHSKAI